ncbi:MAG: isoprenylcysteine carboxylmethyltransferase family protein [Bacteroidota bacterium]|nr:isoprenylcysteine carboxylmethyltransferase family protein [Bacteroidota bacterium]
MTLKIKFALNAFISSLAFSIILFISAGRIDYPQGWIYLFTTLVTAFMNVVTIQSDSELMSERTKAGEGTKPWDKVILGLSFLLFIATMVIAGLDSGRYQWSSPAGRSVNAAGVCLMIAGQIIFLSARKKNKFFSTVVRIQKELGHTVCDSGLYKVVRHPGYLGMMISSVGIPFILGSVWSSVPVVASIILLLVRTILEDKTLIEELEGYAEYAKKTRRKLIPWVW